jgi:hypothetical protein
MPSEEAGRACWCSVLKRKISQCRRAAVRIADPSTSGASTLETSSKGRSTGSFCPIAAAFVVIISSCSAGWLRAEEPPDYGNVIIALHLQLTFSKQFRPIHDLIAMNLVLIVLILLILVGGGGGYYYGGPYVGGGIGSLVLLILIIWLLVGRRRL